MAIAARKVRSATDDHIYHQTFTRNAASKGRATWLSGDVDQPDFRDLMQRMFKALHLEDEQLAHALGPGSKLGREYKDRGVPGLCYWVYEHNLVYPIFKAWAPRFRVLWDERPSASWATQFEETDREYAANDNVPKGLVDLQVVIDPMRDERWLFEVKWMNNSNGVAGARRDVAKLVKLRSQRKGATRAFVIGLWHDSPDRLQADLDWIEQWCPEQVRPGFVGVFSSLVLTPKSRGVEQGYMILSVWEVR